MSTLEYIYLACAIAGAVIFLIRMILMLVGGLGDTDGDVGDVGSMDGADFGDMGDFGNVDAADIDHGGFGIEDTDASFNVLSIQGVSSFIMMFGIVGLAFARMAIHPVLSFLTGVAAGSFTVWVVSLVFKGMIRLQSDGTMKLQNAIDQTGTVYLSIKANDIGKVEIVIQGALQVLDAVSKDGSAIKTGEQVKVVEIRDTQLVVVPINEE